MRRHIFALLILSLIVLISLAAACGASEDAPPSDDLAQVDLDSLDDSLVEAGGLIYAANCARCHGLRGEGADNWKVRGDGGALPPPPQDATGHTWHHGDGLLAQIVQKGCAAYQVGVARCNIPAFPSFTDREIESVLEFLRDWWGPDERAFQAQVSMDDPFPEP